MLLCGIAMRGVDQGRVGRRLTAGAVLLLAMLAAVTIGWTGFIASDDSLYYFGADRWLTDPPFAGDTHWSTRFPLIWSFALVLLLLGRGFAAFAATALLWYIVLVALVGMFAARLANPRTGWIAALLTATLPVVISNATTVSVDLVETSLLIAGAWLLGEAAPGRRGMLHGLAAGICFGAAILCRETSLLSLVAFVPIFFIGRPATRLSLIGAGIGMAAVLGGEGLFQWAMTGDALRRYDIAFHHDAHIDRTANKEGNFLLHPAIDPLLVLFINDDFGMVFWVASAGIYLAGRRLLIGIDTPLLALLAAMALADFLLVGALTHKLVLNPRYFMLPAILAVIGCALWLDWASAWLRRLGLTELVAVNLLLLSVGNAHPRWEMEVLVATCIAHPDEMVSGDPVLVRRASLPLRFAHLANARYAPAPRGGLVVAPIDQAPAGTVLQIRRSPPTRLGAVLEVAGLRPLVPKAIERRMFMPNETIVVVRTPR